MSQAQEQIEKLSADRRKLVWETERLEAEIVLLKRQVAALTERLVEKPPKPRPARKYRGHGGG